MDRTFHRQDISFPRHFRGKKFHRRDILEARIFIDRTFHRQGISQIGHIIDGNFLDIIFPETEQIVYRQIT